MAFVSVTVDLAAIQSLFEPSGGIGIFGQRVNRVAWIRATALAPSRTDRLKSSIFPSPKTTKLGYKVTVGSNLKYAGWVNDGTTGPILPKNGPWLAVGKREGKKPIYRPSVRGQRGQHFLESGINQAFAGTGIGIRV